MDGFDFRHDQVRLFLFDQAAQNGAVQHVDHMAAVCDLHGGCIGVAIHCHHLHRVALQFDRDLFAELPRA
jgi:hypothetical protein